MCHWLMFLMLVQNGLCNVHVSFLLSSEAISMPLCERVIFPWINVQLQSPLFTSHTIINEKQNINKPLETQTKSLRESLESHEICDGKTRIKFTVKHVDSIINKLVSASQIRKKQLIVVLLTAKDLETFRMSQKWGDFSDRKVLFVTFNKSDIHRQQSPKLKIEGCKIQHCSNINQVHEIQSWIKEISLLESDESSEKNSTKSEQKTSTKTKSPNHKIDKKNAKEEKETKPVVLIVIASVIAVILVLGLGITLINWIRNRKNRKMVSEIRERIAIDGMDSKTEAQKFEKAKRIKEANETELAKKLGHQNKFTSLLQRTKRKSDPTKKEGTNSSHSENQTQSSSPKENVLPKTAANPAAKPPVNPATKPAANPAKNPAAKPAANPAVNPAAKPAANTAAKPAAKAEPQTSSQSGSGSGSKDKNPE